MNIPAARSNLEIHKESKPSALLLLPALLAALLFFNLQGRAWAADLPSDLTELSLEELMELEVTSAGRKEQKLADVPAAVFVITPEDIRRSGATNIPEVLRMVPGVQVAQIDANKWAVTIRGFNGRFANKLQVLMDGRSVYTPLFSGVFWDMRDTLLEDIERIEVIRGPGAAMWGANAVNGVINIITKHAKNTQGALLVGGGGTQERGFGSLRYGGKVGESTWYRVYGKYFNRSDAVSTTSLPANDAWDAGRGGFRLDSKVSGSDSLTFTGDLFKGQAGETTKSLSFFPPYTFLENQGIADWGGHLLGRWQRVFSSTSNLELQIYYDGTDRKEGVREIRNTLDLDFQHRFVLGQRHEIIWGLGYRYTHDRFSGNFELSLDPRRKGVNLFSAFFQDDITLIQERLRLILGTRLERNDYTGFEVQPNVRMMWTPQAQHRLWASISRAVRTPYRPEVDGVLNTSITPPSPLVPVPILSYGQGNHDFKSEELLAFELGYRWDFRKKFFLDVAAYYNIYDNLRALTQGPPQLILTPPPHLAVPLLISNAMKGETYGLEVAADWRPLSWWRTQLSYNFLQPKLRLKSSNAVEDPTIVGNDPKNQLSFRSTFDLPQHLELDLWLRYVSALRRLEVSSYVTLDARLAWKPVKNLELALVGQNLLQKRHQEFGPNEFIFPTQVPRGMYGKVTWRY